MKPLDIFLMCLRNLLKRKTRTLLTVIGVIIGICALVLMISLGIGLNSALRFMVSEWEDLTLIEVNNYGGVNENGIKPEDMTDDVLASFLEMDHVKAVTPFYYRMYVGDQFVVYSGDYAILSAPFVGVYMDSLEDFGYTLIEGRWKDKNDPKNTVIFGSSTGAYMYDYVFEEYVNGEYDMEGNIKSYVVDLNSEFRIVPLMVDYENRTWPPDYSFIGSETAPNSEYDGELNVVGRLQGNWREWYTMEGILIDVSCINDYIKMYNELNSDYQYQEFTGVYDTVKIRVDDMDNVTDVEKQLKELGYQTYYDGKAREQMKAQLMLIQVLLSSLALVSIIVATLNIANTMITAIIERTKEIGIMKVLGCEINKIHAMFLGEAAIIGFIGGLLGLLLSFIMSLLFNSLLTNVMIGFLSGNSGMYEFPEGIKISQIPLWLVAASLAFSTLVGVIAGIYPAYRSTKISALSAITNE